jgi:nicotinate-nucleotide adenylyltransferase
MKIGIFGGSFNPPTKGHIRLCNYLVENGVVDTVLLMPCYKSLYNKGLVDGNKRLDMLAMTTHHPKVKPFDWEIKNKIDGPGTYQIMKMITEELSPDTLYFIIGLDNAQKVKSWKNGDIIVDRMNFIVVPRKGVVTTDEWYKKSPHIYVDGYEEDAISSTLVKERLKKGEDVSDLLDKYVEDYIRTNKLYID